MTKPQSIVQEEMPPKMIRIAAAIITDERGHVLLVRKHGSRFFIQPGGKIEPGESSLDALKRELKEELGCVPTRIEPFGQFSAPAVNEPGHTVEADLYRVDVSVPIRPAAEIAEVAWVDPADPGDILAAPLTRDYILTPVLQRRGIAFTSDANLPQSRKPMEMNFQRVAAAYLLRGKHSRMRQDAFSHVQDLLQRDPEQAWQFTLCAITMCKDDHDLALVAAGPLEELLKKHGSKFIDRIEAESRTNPKMVRAMSGAWINEKDTIFPRWLAMMKKYGFAAGVQRRL